MSKRKKKRAHGLRRDAVAHAAGPAPKAGGPVQHVQIPTQQAGETPPADETRHPPSSIEAVEIHGSVPYDEALLDVCRTRWQFADWERLAAIDAEHLLHHPQRAKIALLVAAAHWQVGQTQQAHRLTQRALDWGASPRQAAQLLISGVHHSLASAHALLEHGDAAYAHHLASLRAGGVPGDAELLATARSQRMQKDHTEGRR